jgi:uncharacterized protein (DUF2267 family)
MPLLVARKLALASAPFGPIQACMDYDQFVTTVEQALDIGRSRAERAIQATLQTVAERIGKGEARQLAAELPPELAPWLATTGGAEGFDVDEFLRRVAEREGDGVDVASAERHVKAVFRALMLAVPAKEFDDMAAELSKDYAPLLPRGPAIDVVGLDAFLQRVAHRAAIDIDGARRASEAVLETLASRIAGGEVDDLIARLPIELHPALKRGKELSRGKATRMSFEEFVRRVAEREGVSFDSAREHVGAVLSTLRDALGEEFYDVTSQLPDEYLGVLARR